MLRCHDENRDRSKSFDCGKERKSEKGSGTKDLTDQSDDSQTHGKSKSHTNSIKNRFDWSILGCIAFCTAKNDTVYNDQWNIHTKCLRKLGRYACIRNCTTVTSDATITI